MLLRTLFGLVFGLASSLVLASAAPAETTRNDAKVVVELFTSQGCASCPPADALLTSLAERPDVVALAYHVDYWDYIGWQDTFGHETFSDRQRAYAKSWGSSRIYTPQMVVNGQKPVVGSRRTEVQGAISDAQLPLAIEVRREGDMLKVHVPPDAELPNAVVWLVTYIDRADVSIDRGDNAGKAMVYTQVVTGRQILGMWEARSGAELKLPLNEMLGAGNSGLAILVQLENKGLPGAILAAAAYEP
ncbi:MAG: DUF1223 domain-containing protein [Devosia sp.]|nr:DUF1223 domain-containing protein [Devosia sp.]